MYTELVLHNGLFSYLNGCAKMRTQLRHRRRVWLPAAAIRYLEVKSILRGPFGSERSSVIENWEVVRFSEARNV